MVRLIFIVSVGKQPAFAPGRERSRKTDNLDNLFGSFHVGAIVPRVCANGAYFATAQNTRCSQDRLVLP